MSETRSLAQVKTQQIISEQFLMKQLILKMKKYNLNPQIINTLRFSCQRFDSTRSNQIYGKNFKDLYRYVNVRMARADEQNEEHA